ncbi:hypothetical protein [Bosea sp. 685]|uniref:hypothetical protein n=1 Tax=Bosea sp. 685 TaxID=3080057 RepID=UPI00289330ED|nr:hypothetical protein [Bosea sp. 685]WNJ93019.1 hypothetical protein RMR04_12315 [Bosea sp. 685]
MIDLATLKGKRTDLRALFPALTTDDVALVDRALGGNRSGFVAAVCFQADTLWSGRPGEPLKDAQARMARIAAAAQIFADNLDVLDVALTLPDDTGDAAFTRPSDLLVYMKLLASRANALATDNHKLKVARFQDPTKRKQRGVTPSSLITRRMIAEYFICHAELPIHEGSDLRRLIEIGHLAAGVDDPSASNIGNLVADFASRQDRSPADPYLE